MASRRAASFTGGSKVPRNPNFTAAFGTALNGLRFVFQSEPNFRVHCLAAGIVAALALWFGVTRMEAAMLTFACVLVLGAEMINTTLERIVNLVSPEWHEDARLAKDAAAGMVLLMVVAASLCGLWILGPYVF
jgi:diacylglycerol kinase